MCELDRKIYISYCTVWAYPGREMLSLSYDTCICVLEFDPLSLYSDHKILPLKFDPCIWVTKTPKVRLHKCKSTFPGMARNFLLIMGPVWERVFYITSILRNSVGMISQTNRIKSF